MTPTPYDALPPELLAEVARRRPRPGAGLRRHRPRPGRGPPRRAPTTRPASRPSPPTPPAAPTGRPASPVSSPASRWPRWSSTSSWATTVTITGRVADGTRVARGDVVLHVAGPTRGLLTAERTALNFASHLSGVATATSRWVAALEGTRARVLDTRKTLPGWRALQKYAVRCGGGVNHRFSLVRQGDDQGQPRHRGRGRGRRRSRPCARRTPDLPVVRSRSPTSTSSAALLDVGARVDPARQHGRRDDGRGGARSTAAARSSRRPAGSPSSGPARSPRPGSTTSRSGP